LRVEHHAEVAVVGQFLHCFFGGGGSLRPLLGLAVGVDDFLIAAAGVFIAQGQHLAEGFDRGGVVFLFAIDHAEALDEDGAVVAVGLAGSDFAMFSALEQILQNLNGVVVAALRLINGGHAVGDVHGVGHQGVGALETVEGQVVFGLTAVNLSHADVSLRIFGIGVGDDFVLLESGVELAVIQ